MIEKVMLDYFASALILLASLLFKLEALFLWIVPRFANLSIIEATSGCFSVAPAFSSIALMSRIALRVVLP
jgi:hypothetical protein